MNRLGLAAVALVVILAAFYLFAGNLGTGNPSGNKSAQASNQNQYNANQTAGNSSGAQSTPYTNVTTINPTTTAGRTPSADQFIVASPVNL